VQDLLHLLSTDLFMAIQAQIISTKARKHVPAPNTEPPAPKGAKVSNPVKPKVPALRRQPSNASISSNSSVADGPPASEASDDEHPITSNPSIRADKRKRGEGDITDDEEPDDEPIKM
jgi:hypothetical protein